MSSAVVAITYAEIPGFPAGSVVASIVATLVGTVNVTPITQTGSPGVTTLTFANLAADTYSYSVSGEDPSGNIFGSPVTGSFTVTAPATVSLSLPSAVSVTQE
jgi:hypothetical protein